MEDPSTIIQPFPLGRLPSTDENDKKFLLKKLLTPTTKTYRYWNESAWYGNQMQLPYCVGFAWAHWIEDGPVVHKGIPPIVDPNLIYLEAQKVDEWEGQNYDGTSVRAGAKVLQQMNVISEYNWAWDLPTLVNAVLTKGPVVVGTEWWSQMFYPDALGMIRLGGDVMGGHAYVVNGVNAKTKMLRIKNSWGQDWGIKGRAFISFDDMATLINHNGEVCLGVENKLISF